MRGISRISKTVTNSAGRNFFIALFQEGETSAFFRSIGLLFWPVTARFYSFRFCSTL